MKTGVTGRADLIDAYLAGGPELQSVVARLLGMELVPPEPIEVPPKAQAPDVPADSELPPPAVACHRRGLSFLSRTQSIRED